MKKYLKRVLPVLILVLGVGIVFWNFLQNNASRISRQDEEYLYELTTQRAISINSLIAENLNFIQSTAYLYGENLSSRQVDVNVIRDFEENSVFDYLRFVDADGDDYTSSGLMANLSDRDYFQAGMQGASGVTYVLNSRVTGEKQIGFYAPVSYEEEVIGIMIGFYGESYIRNMLEYELFDKPGEGWLCTREGIVLGSTMQEEPDNYLDYMRDNGRCDPEEMTRLTQAFAAGEELAFQYSRDGVNAAGYAVGLSGADWVLIRNFPPEAYQEMLDNANRTGITLVLELILLFLAFVLYLGIDFFLEKRRTREANQNANDISTGVAKLFERFVVLDLRTEEYYYISGKSDDRMLPRRGAYQSLFDNLIGRIPGEAQQREARDYLLPEKLQESLRDKDLVSLRLHAPIQDDEWFTYNFIVLDRENTLPSRVLLLRQDVTQLHQKEEAEQRKLQEALDTAEKASKAKTEFLFNMSHDLRTPMNAIIGYTELAQHEGVSKEQILDYVHKIDSSSQHLLTLINDILEMSRIETGKVSLDPEPTDLREVVQDAKELFETQMRGKGIDFRVDGEEIQNSVVLCDKNRLNRIVLNLLSNAYKFTPEGGTVSLILREMDAADAMEAKGDVFRDGDSPQRLDKDSQSLIAHYELRVKDSGIGMSQEFVEKLFKPFERERTSTVSKIQGTGLGLSITKNFVDLMGGDIRVNTKQNEGTEFVVTLFFPVLEQEESAGDERQQENQSLDFSKVRLLLVEDNEINREIATMMLSEMGFQLETAANGQIAVEMVAASEPGYYQAVLMDIQMPVMDGYTATRAIRSLEQGDLARIPIIAMTANAFREDVETALAAGMNAHIAKPLDIMKMMETLTEVLKTYRENG